FYGVYELGDGHGEWVADGFAADFYGRSPARNPHAPGTPDEVWVVRGISSGVAVRDSSRAAAANIGFRCAGSTEDLIEP
ncbi:MAG: hypothetical protein VX528_08180, partial [Candidatus Latescibacterota bacterium]|nr:hypothetical protein [Candidatus Latescibacterota bacterium]